MNRKFCVVIDTLIKLGLFFPEIENDFFKKERH